jgi:glycosyltransferase involved in cell wall biosynthesis
VLVYGISMVRNEADIIRANVLYHLASGVDRMLVVDNGSTDGTDGALQQLSLEHPEVRWSRDDGPFLPSRVMTKLAREAFEEGADWVVPVDADEFWYAPGGDLRRVLEIAKAGVLRAQAVNFIQRRSQRESAPDALMYMTRRAASPVGPPSHAQSLVEARQIAFVEKTYPQKCICRPTAEVKIETGHHSISGADGPRMRTEEIVCLHAPMRSLAALVERVTSASRAVAAGRNPNQGRNRRRLAALQDEKAIDAEWAANSYEDGFLDVYGEKHPVVFDPRLRDAVSPFIPRPFWKKLLSPLGR